MRRSTREKEKKYKNRILKREGESDSEEDDNPKIPRVPTSLFDGSRYLGE